MKITMMSRWNIPCGVSLHAELIGRAWVEMGHDLTVLAPVEWEGYRSSPDEPYVRRCYRLPEPRRKEGFFFDPKPFLHGDPDIFVVENLEILPMEDLLRIYPHIRKRAKTVLVVHEGRPPADQTFYRFDWDGVVCFDRRYKRFLKEIYPEERIHIIPYPCHPVRHGDKSEARQKLGLPQDKRIIFNYGIGVYRHLHLLPSIKRVNHDHPLMLLTMTHIQDWYELFDAVRWAYPFIELRKGEIPTDELYTYLHASDVLLIHKDSAEAVVVPSTACLCLGAGRPILAYDTNFFETFDGEVIKYRELEVTLRELFQDKYDIESTLESAERFVKRNSSEVVAETFLRLFESLLSRYPFSRALPFRREAPRGSPFLPKETGYGGGDPFLRSGGGIAGRKAG
ncbi:MAG: hypothetical protein JRJ26_08315 [Deltaproteobacteria bacterium]|nr:hypothetical protein [Deltaproteobacteria bacterium]